MPITVSVIVLAGLVAGIYGLFAFVQKKFGAPDERTLPLREIAGLIEQLQAQHSAEAMVAIQGPTESQYFEIRFVDGQFRLEYQIVFPCQVANESKFRDAARHAGVATEYWGDGSDGWDKYVSAQLGRNAGDALEIVGRILKQFGGLDASSTVTVRTQDFSVPPRWRERQPG